MANLLDTIGMELSGAMTPPLSTPPKIGEPTWDIARLFPAQGKWTEEQYLQVAESVNCFIEFDKGFIEVLPMPTIEHQILVKFFLMALDRFVEAIDIGTVLTGPVSVWLDEELYKEPDVLFATKERHAASEEYYRGIDLAVEIVSNDARSHQRDWVEKREKYATAGVAEYWIVDPQQERVMVLSLAGKKYAEHADLTKQGTATSKLLEGFSVDIAKLFAAGKQR